MTNRYEQRYLPDGRPAYIYRSAGAAVTAALAATVGENVMNALSPSAWPRLSRTLLSELKANGYDVVPRIGEAGSGSRRSPPR